MSSADRILEMVKARNHPTYPLTLTSVVFENMTTEGAADHNTKIVMRSRGVQTGYTGQVNLYYTRVNLSTLGPMAYAQEEPYTLSTLLDAINADKTAQITIEDLTNMELPAIPNGVPTPVLLSAADSSLAWLNNATVTILNGLPASAADFNNFWATEVGLLFV